MLHSNVRILLLLMSSIVCCACGEKQKIDKKETIPVKGKVLVDGQPAGMLTIDCVAVSGIDKERPSLSTAMTDDKGDFALGTYAAGDGVPEGEYALTFQWGTLNTFKHSFDGDKLNGRYSDAKSSTVTFTAKKGTPVDLGKIELKSQ